MKASARAEQVGGALYSRLVCGTAPILAKPSRSSSRSFPLDDPTPPFSDGRESEGPLGIIHLEERRDRGGRFPQALDHDPEFLFG